MGKELELAIKIGGRLDKSLGSAINAAQQQLNSIGNMANKVGMAATAAVAAGSIKLVKDGIQEFQNYQSAINSAAATGGIEVGTAEYEMLDNAAREAGRTTVKTAEESANALEYMMLAGWSAADSAKALTPVLKLSASTGADLATTSDLVTDSMANLGLGIDDLNHYLDVSATANNKTNQTAMQLQEAYLGVGGTLKNLNSPIEESAAVLGVLANRGTKGSEAGTALSAILVNMQKKSGDASKAMAQLGVSMYDANGNARSIIDVFQDISNKTGSMTEQQRNLMYQMIGGKSHVSSFAKIMAGFNDTTADGQKEVYSLINAFKNSDGALDKLYDIKTDTLAGSMETLKSAYSSMLIDIGETASPILQDAIEDLTDKMPQIQEVIISALERILPAISKVLDFVVDNSDKIISAIMGITKAFVGFKLGTGAIKGINSIVGLVKNLSKIGAASGAAKTITGIFGSLTGISTASGTVAGAFTGLIGSFAAAIAPATLAAAAIAGVAVAVNAVHKHKMNYASGMNEAADGVEKASNALVKYNDIAAEIPTLRQIISDENSSTAEVESAKARLQEIASLLSEEYNLTINADTSSLENAVNMAQQLSRTELIDNSNKLINKATKNAEKYKSDMSAMPGLQAEQKILQDQQVLYKSLQAEASQYRAAFDNGQSSYEQYMSNMNTLYDRAKKSNLVDENILGSTLNAYNTQGFLEQLGNGFLRTDEALTKVNGKIETANKNITEFDESTQKAGEYLTQALASDVKNNNAYGADTDISMIENLGKAMIAAGKNTDELSTKFAKAKSGYTDFAEAIAAGKASEMAQSFIDYKTAIGDTAESAVQGAALIANGFENVTQATAAGDEAIGNIIADMKSLGDVQGIFDGLDSNGVADKLTDMAHAMQLIPENKSITIDANGNFEVITEAENRIASLNSVGNVNVSVDANGNLTILDEATNKMGTLQDFGAASLQVNAEGNIDVLNQAREVIATIDSKSAQININGQAYGLDQIEQAKNAAAGLDNKSATVTATATDNASPTIEGVQNKLTTLNGTTANPKITASDQASGTISSVASQLSSLDGTTATTTVITKYETQGTPPGKSAKGTPNWRGGLTYVNDQNISDPREVIEHNGMRYWYEGKNVLADVPRGARIYNAAASRQFIDGSHKNGLERVPFDGYIAELHKGEQVLTADEATDYSEKGLFAQAIDRLKDVISGGSKSQNNDDSGSGGGKIVFSPTYQIYGNVDRNEVREGAKMSLRDFERMYDELMRDKRRKDF